LRLRHHGSLRRDEGGRILPAAIQSGEDVNKNRTIRRPLLTALAALTSFGIATMSIAADRLTDKSFTTRSEVIAPQGMAATSQPLATQIALDILKAGGSAADAAIAANAALGLMEPVGSGIGGDLFAIVWDADKKELAGLNASGRSPKSLTLEHLKSLGLEKIPALGPLPVSVPGAVDGWFELHERYGKLPMSEVLAPAIRYAREGFPLTEVIAFYWGRNANYLKDYPGFAEVFMPGGKAPAKGEMFRNPKLADTYERLGKEGRDVFYKGDMARAIANYMAENDGFLSYEDMAGHASEWIDPVSTNYRGYDVWELPPNGQGIAALQILNILEGYDIAAMGFGSPEYVHAFVEAKKLAFEDRARFYADMDFYDVPVAKLISKEYADERRKLIDPDRAARSYPAGDAALKQGDTGKRPFHTIIPAFVTKDGKPFMSFGVMGGAMQPQGHAQIIINMIDFGMNLQEAGDAPRIRHTGSSQPTDQVMKDGGTVYLERGYPLETVNALKQRRHRVGVEMGGYGGYQAIMRDDEQGVYYGASESRKDGHAAGY
jgi:gamma-glutamyltranspeptidase/glutathione hydrolase